MKKKKKIVIYNTKDLEYKTAIGRLPFVMDRDRGNLLITSMDTTIDRLYQQVIGKCTSGGCRHRIPPVEEIKECKRKNDVEVNQILNMVSMIEKLVDVLEEVDGYMFTRPAEEA